MAGTRIVILKGSPRRNGNSAALADALADAARDAGATVESFYLHGMDIRPCNACDSCHEHTDKDCVVKDDMRKLYPKLREADAVVVASPIYWFTVSAQTKLFMDRCYALGGPEGYAWSGKRIGILLTYADEDPYKSGAANAMRTFQDGFGYVDAPIVGMVYATADKAGEIRRNTAVMEQARELGRQLASP
jgi:multimeric flavodoxin WrbA